MSILAKLPLVVRTHQVRAKVLPHTQSMQAYLVHKLSALGSTIWHFILEAKDLRPPVKNLELNLNLPVERVKKIFRIRINQPKGDQAWLPEVADTVASPAVVEQTEKPRTAEDVYLSAIKKDKNNKEAYEGLGRLYLQERNFEDAAETFEFLTHLDPTRDVYFSNLGLTYYSLGKYQNAARAYEKALRINSKVPARWINLALCFQAMDDPVKSIKAINSAIQLDARNTNYLNLLADTYLKVGNAVRAEEVLQQILVLDPTNKSVREKLMRIKI